MCSNADTADIIASVVDTEDGESDDDVGDELPAVTYKDACLAKLFFKLTLCILSTQSKVLSIVILYPSVI